MAQRIQAVVFGLEHVLARTAYLKTCKRIEPFSDLSLKSIYEKIFDSKYTRAYEKGEIDSETFYRVIMWRIGISKNKPTFQEFSSMWGNIFLEDRNIEHVLSRIKPEIRKVLLPNTNELHWGYAKNLSFIEKFFEDTRHIVLSYCHGYRKPESEFFSLAIKATGIIYRNAILYVDHNPEHVEAFKRLGGQGIVHDCKKDCALTLGKKLAAFDVSTGS